MIGSKETILIVTISLSPLLLCYFSKETFKFLDKTAKKSFWKSKG